jgi:HD-GYP domain-containing protein (c-di-GMP phosphodiesterase class II)
VFQPQELDWELSHAARSAILAMRVGMELTDDETSLRLLGESAFLHDIGLFVIPPAILHKNGPLSEEERAIVRGHTIEGVKLLLTGSDFPPAAVEAALLHHSSPTPGGYPEVSETSTPSTVAKIIKVVDAYESIIGTRPYRRSRSPLEAASELIRGAGETFDRAVVGRVVRTIGFFPIGSMVRLSDGSIAQVRTHDQTRMTTPAVTLLIDGAGEVVNPPREVDLAAEGQELTIREGLPFEREPMHAAAC